MHKALFAPAKYVIHVLIVVLSREANSLLIQLSSATKGDLTLYCIEIEWHSEKKSKKPLKNTNTVLKVMIILWRLIGVSLLKRFEKTSLMGYFLHHQNSLVSPKLSSLASICTKTGR